MTEVLTDNTTQTTADRLGEYVLVDIRLYQTEDIKVKMARTLSIYVLTPPLIY